MQDFTNDPVLRPVLAAVQKGVMPDWVIAAEPTPHGELRKLASVAFAVPANRVLPLDTKAATMMAAAYVAYAPGQYPESAAARVKEAATAFNLTAEVEAIFAAFSGEKQAAAPLNPEPEKLAYALTLDDGEPFGLPSGPHSFLPCHDEWHIERSSEELAKKASENGIPPELVYKAAAALFEAAEKGGVLDILDPFVRTLGEPKMANWTRAENLLFSRRPLVPAESFEAYEEVVKLGSENPEIADEVIEAMRDLDAQHGIDYWSRKSASVPSPWELVYSGISLADVEKMAATHFVVADALVPLDVFTEVPDAVIDQQFAGVQATRIKAAKALDVPEATASLGELDEVAQRRLFDLCAEFR